MTKEEIKRLNIKDSTIKELFALSRNYCAFQNCTENIITRDGTLLGEVCHIEACKTTGERFNSTMTNESRREISNLILLCGNHHKTTNNVNEYSVKRMKEIKKTHEDKAFEQLNKLSKFTEIRDLTKNNNDNTFPSSLNKLFTNINSGHNTEDNNDLLYEYEEIFNKLRSLPDHMRQTLTLILEKMLNDPNSGKNWYQVTWITLKNECGDISEPELLERTRYLQEKKFIEIDEDEFGCKVSLKGYIDGNFLHWILDFAKSKNLNLNSIIANYDFSLLN